MKLGFSFLAVVGLHILLQSGTPVQGTVAWNRPVNISNTLTGSAHPAIVTDAYGYVHVIWSENTAGGEFVPELATAGNTLFYARFDGSSWTLPLDLFYMAGDPVADYPRLTIDKEQWLHLVWTGLENIYYSQAPAGEAYAALAWRPPVVLSENSARSRFESSVAVDDMGIIHVAYAGREAEKGVFYRRSLDGGHSWEMSLLLSRPSKPHEAAYSTVQVVDLSDVVHVVWETSDERGYGRGVYYRRSLDHGAAWEPPLTIKFTEQEETFVGWPYLFVDGEGQLHLIYALEENVARGYRVSADNGRTWRVEERILPEMEGINGYVFPVEDAASNLHLIVNMRPSATQETGVYYAAYSGQRWFPVTPVALGEPYGPAAHYTAGAVRLGNEIHLVWTDLGGGEIWYTRGFIPGVTAVPPISVPVAPVEETATGESPTLLDDGKPDEPAVLTFDRTASPADGYDLVPLFASIAAAVLMLVPVLLWWRSHR
jgi:hypothetical protein